MADQQYLDVSAAGAAVAAQPQQAPLQAPAQQQSDFSQQSIVIAYRKLSYVWSTLLLIFALIIVVHGLIQEWGNPPWNIADSHPAAEVVIFFAFLCWISLLEGCQISIVGLQGIDMEPYKNSHPRAYQSCKLVHKGPNVERFLVGRQFLLLFNGFLVSRVGGGGKHADDYSIGEWDWNLEASQLFWGNSILLLIIILAFQLVTQLLACDKMLGFFNLPLGMHYIVVWPCLLVEAIGLTHSTYLLKDILTKAAGIDESQADPEKKMDKNIFYYARVCLSTSAVIFCGIFLFKGLGLGQMNATNGAGWDNLPEWAAILVAILFLTVMACAEGLQVSVLALARTSSSDIKAKAPLAYRTCQLVYAGRNMQAFMVGRQFFVALMMILLGRVTGYAGTDGVIDGDDWGMGAGFNEWFLQTGFCGAIFVVNVAQLASQVTASIFPVSFINNYPMNWLLRIMLLTEASGIVNACWPITWAWDRMMGLGPDPFDGDENANTPAQNVMDRKKSMGIPVTKGVSPYDLHQPEQEYHVEYTYKVSYI